MSFTESRNGQSWKGPQSLAVWSNLPAQAGSVPEHTAQARRVLNISRERDSPVSLGSLDLVQFIHVILVKEISPLRVK